MLGAEKGYRKNDGVLTGGHKADMLKARQTKMERNQ